MVCEVTIYGIGQRLSIFPRTPYVSSTKKKTPTKKQAPITGKTYTVKPGDTLWSISQKLKEVTIDDLRDWNGIRGSGIKPGMKLKVSSL